MSEGSRDRSSRGRVFSWNTVLLITGGVAMVVAGAVWWRRTRKSATLSSQEDSPAREQECQPRSHSHENTCPPLDHSEQQEVASSSTHPSQPQSPGSWMETLEASEVKEVQGVVASASRTNQTQEGSRRVFLFPGAQARLAVEIRNLGDGERRCVIEVIRPRCRDPHHPEEVDVPAVSLRVLQHERTGTEELMVGRHRLLVLSCQEQDSLLETERSDEETLWMEPRQMVEWVLHHLQMAPQEWVDLMQYLAPGFPSLGLVQ